MKDKELFDKDSRAKYEFRDENKAIFQTERGLSIDTIKTISKIKNEPDFMLDFRLKALDTFFKMKQPSFGPDLNFIDFQDYTYYTRVTDKISSSWDEVPEEIKNTF